MGKIKFVQRRVNFADCELDIDNNILQAPLCHCGCGNYIDLVLEDDQNVAEFLYNMLEIQECCHCAIFVLMKDNTVIIGAREDDDINVYKLGCIDKNGLNIDIIRELQEDAVYHCYGLLEQKDEKGYRIVME